MTLHPKLRAKALAVLAFIFWPLAMHAASNELVKLIRKLRWMGMEEQAEGLQRELERRHATGAVSVLATQSETD